MASSRRERGRRRSAPATGKRGSGHDIIVVGASAGGVDAVSAVLGALPHDLRATVCVVVHLSAASPGTLPEIFGKASPLPVDSARDGAAIEPGRVWVAPPDRHLLVERGRLRVMRGPRENRHRPSIDPLFRSAAWAYGPRVVGVILSGMLDDGSAGLWAVKTCGGLAIVQAPSDAQFPDMPRNALTHTAVDEVLPLREIGPRLVQLVARRAARRRRAAPRVVEAETRLARHEGGIIEVASLGKLSPFSCPSCGGTLWEIENGEQPRFRCHTGHAFSQATLSVAQAEETEEALNAALRSMHEQTRSLRRIADQFGHYPDLRRRNLERAELLEASARTLRKMLKRG